MRSSQTLTQRKEQSGRTNSMKYEYYTLYNAYCLSYAEKSSALFLSFTRPVIHPKKRVINSSSIRSSFVEEIQLK